MIVLLVLIRRLVICVILESNFDISIAFSSKAMDINWVFDLHLCIYSRCFNYLLINKNTF